MIARTMRASTRPDGITRSSTWSTIKGSPNPNILIRMPNMQIIVKPRRTGINPITCVIKLFPYLTLFWITIISTKSSIYTRNFVIAWFQIQIIFRLWFEILSQPLNQAVIIAKVEIHLVWSMKLISNNMQCFKLTPARM